MREGEGEGEEGHGNGGKKEKVVWETSSEKREDSLRGRKERMVLEARRWVSLSFLFLFFSLVSFVRFVRCFALRFLSLASAFHFLVLAKGLRNSVCVFFLTKNVIDLPFLFFFFLSFLFFRKLLMKEQERLSKGKGKGKMEGGMIV